MSRACRSVHIFCIFSACQRNKNIMLDKTNYDKTSPNVVERCHIPCIHYVIRTGWNAACSIDCRGPNIRKHEATRVFDVTQWLQKTWWIWYRNDNAGMQLDQERYFRSGSKHTCLIEQKHSPPPRGLSASTMRQGNVLLAKKSSFGQDFNEFPRNIFFFKMHYLGSGLRRRFHNGSGSALVLVFNSTP